METWIKINNQTAGRDKIARLLQYLSRLLWHRLQQNNKNGVNGLKNLEFQLSTFRRVLRFGRFIETLYGALPLFQHPDPAIRYSLILSKIATSIFLFADHFLWLGRADLCDINLEKWGRLCNKYWLASIAMSLARDLYEILLIVQASKSTILPVNGVRNFGDVLQVIGRFLGVLQKHNNVLVDTVKNSCDVFIPLTALGHVKLSPGAVGLLGAVSSLAGLLVMVDPSKKLSPA